MENNKIVDLPDGEKRKTQTILQNILSERNNLSKEIGILKSKKQNIDNVLKKVEKLKNKPNAAPIKTWSRKCTIIPEFVGHSFLIHNGKKFIPIKISDEMASYSLLDITKNY